MKIILKAPSLHLANLQGKFKLTEKSPHIHKFL
jgi:hypothetical protein